MQSQKPMGAAPEIKDLNSGFSYQEHKNTRWPDVPHGCLSSLLDLLQKYNLVKQAAVRGEILAHSRSWLDHLYTGGVHS